MPQLRWNDTDVLDFFAVEPTVEDYGVSHNYEIERDGMRLLFTLWQLESVIQASLFRGKSTTHCSLLRPTSEVKLASSMMSGVGTSTSKLHHCSEPIRYIQAGNPFDQQRFPYPSQYGWRLTLTFGLPLLTTNVAHDKGEQSGEPERADRRILKINGIWPPPVYRSRYRRNTIVEHRDANESCRRIRAAHPSGYAANCLS